jgi:hypothetical protein
MIQAFQKVKIQYFLKVHRIPKNQKKKEKILLKINTKQILLLKKRKNQMYQIL